MDTYEELADAKNKGRVCIRSGSHPYNLSLFGAVTEHLARGRRPRPGSKAWWAIWRARPKAATPTRSRAWPSGECGIAVTNTYYLARMLRSNSPEDQAVMDKVGVVFPNQSPAGVRT